jgi:hypothetical protein
VVTIPAFLLGAFVLGTTIRRLVRVTRGSVVVAVPLVPQQTVRFESDEPRLHLNIEGRLMQRGLSDFSYQIEADSGAARSVSMQRLLVRTSVSSGTRSRLSLFELTPLRAGRYLLRIGGIVPGGDYEDARVVFTRPIGTAIVTNVIGIVLSAAIVIGSMVASGFALFWRR